MKLREKLLIVLCCVLFAGYVLAAIPDGQSVKNYFAASSDGNNDLNIYGVLSTKAGSSVSFGGTVASLGTATFVNATVTGTLNSNGTFNGDTVDIDGVTAIDNTVTINGGTADYDVIIYGNDKTAMLHVNAGTLSVDLGFDLDVGRNLDADTLAAVALSASSVDIVTLNADTLDIDAVANIQGPTTINDTTADSDVVIYGNDKTAMATFDAGTLSLDLGFDLDVARNLDADTLAAVALEASSVDVTGTFNADTLDVDGIANIQGPTTINDTTADSDVIIYGDDKTALATFDAGNLSLDIGFDADIAGTTDADTLNVSGVATLASSANSIGGITGSALLMIFDTGTANGATLGDGSTATNCTVSIAQNTLPAGGVLKVHAMGTFAGGNAAGTIHLNIDGTDICTTAQATAGADDWVFDATMYQVTAASQEVDCVLNADTDAAIVATRATDTTDFSAGAITVQVNIQSGHGSDTTTLESCQIFAAP